MNASTATDLTRRVDVLTALVDELAAAHEDTVRLATWPEPAPAIDWELHLDYVRALQRLARTVLAHG